MSEKSIGSLQSSQFIAEVYFDSLTLGKAVVHALAAVSQ